jgi:hypothetical protein
MNRIAGRMMSDMMSDLSKAFYCQRDPEIAREAGATFLIFNDGLIQGHPDDEALLLKGMQGYTAYASAFLINTDPERAFIHYSQALEYGFKVLARHFPDVDFSSMALEDCEKVLKRATARDVPVLYWTASAWAGWITTHEDSIASIADLPKVVAMMETVLRLDDRYQYGGVHLFFGIYYAARPPALGGDLDASYKHFQAAIKSASPDALMPRVLMARYYARASFNQELFETTLKQVIDAPPASDPELNLMNALARRQAAELLKNMDDYF